MQLLGVSRDILRQQTPLTEYQIIWLYIVCLGVILTVLQQEPPRMVELFRSLFMHDEGGIALIRLNRDGPSITQRSALYAPRRFNG